MTPFSMTQMVPQTSMTKHFHLKSGAEWITGKAQYKSQSRYRCSGKCPALVYLLSNVPHQINKVGLPKSGFMKPKRTNLMAYGGSRIEQYGTVEKTCKHEDYACGQLRWTGIMGLPSCWALKLLTLHCEVTEQNASPMIADKNTSDHCNQHSMKMPSGTTLDIPT